MATQADIMRIINYFGESSSIYQKIQFGSATDSDISFALSQIPRMETVRSASGSVLGYSYADPVYTVPYSGMNIVTELDSNGGVPSYDGVRGNFPISFGRDSGGAYIDSGRNVSTLSKVMTVADKVGLAVTGVNIGAKLGQKIDSAIYNLNPSWWDEHFPTINPETWPSLAGQSETGQWFVRTLFGIENDGSVTAYVDEQIVAQTYQMLRDAGLWSAVKITPGTPPNVGDYITNDDLTKLPNDTVLQGSIGFNHPSTEYNYNANLRGYDGVLVTMDVSSIAIASKQHNNTSITTTGPYRVTSVNGDQINITPSIATNTDRVPHQRSDGLVYISSSVRFPSNYVTINPNATYLAYVVRATVSTGGIEGISEIQGATQYPPDNITADNLPEVLQQLKQEYPDLFNDAIREDVLQPDGTIEPHTYIPIPWQITSPLDLSQTQPVTRDNPTTDTLIDPEIAPDLVTQTETTPVTPTPPMQDTPDTGEGSTPISPLPSGSASSLWAVYNPTQGEVNAFGAWLWNSNFVEQLKKLFSDPMQSIIGIHKVFVTPETGGSQTIKCGYLDSGVSSKVVTNQYTSVDCGSVNLREYFGNVFDYEPYTKVSIFLPFIGIVPLDVEYIMRSSISVDYKVDVITGACLANIIVNRDGYSSVIFTYSGSAIVSYPVSSGSYVGVISGAMSILAGVAGTIASGGSALPAAMGALSGLGRMRTNVQHSGQFSGSAGAMGIKVPYLIISRPQTKMARDVSKFSGYPSNNHTVIGTCEGFTQVESVHLEIPTAYSSEMNEIEQLLKTGIII